MEREGWCGRWTNLFPNNFQCSAVQRGWPAGIMYTRGLAGLSSRGTVRRGREGGLRERHEMERERNDIGAREKREESGWCG